MDWSISFAPFVPWPIFAGLAVIAAVLLIPGLLRRMRGAWYRIAAAVALLLALANPILLNEQREPQPTVVALVVDQSASQKLDNRDKTTAAAVTELQQRLAQFKNVEVRTIDAAGPQQGGLVDGTQLFTPLSTALADVPPDRIGAVIMLTDGEVHDIPANRSALPPSAPLHVLLSGHDGEKDRRIVIDSAPRFGIVNEQQTIKYRVIDDGGSNAATVHVKVTDDGKPLSVETVTPGFPAELTVNIDHEGPNVIEFEAEPLAGELTPFNNRTAVEVQGIRENLRVLLVSGEPNAGERTWRNLLKSDPSVDLVHFTILRPPDKQDGTPINQLSLIAFPTRELFADKLDQFDLIIFDRYQQQGVLPLPYFDNIAKYVQNGGAVLVAAGPDYADSGGLYDTPLSAILPAAPTGKILNEPFKAEITELGLKHPVTRGLPGSGSAPDQPPTWSRFFRLIDVDTPTSGSVVMKGAEGKPLLILDHQGMGRVALLLTDDMWLWARGYEGGGPQVDLLRRLAHWLMKEPDLDEEALRATAHGDELTIERQTMADSTTPVTLVGPSGTSQTLTLTSNEPGLWRTTVKADEVGLYRAQEDDKTAFVEVGTANPLEFSDAISTPDKLAPLVKDTGGRIARMADASGNLQLPRIVPVRSTVTMSGPDWIGIHQTEATVLTGVNRIPLFYGFLGLFGVAGLFGLIALIGLPFATWIREGR
jgi:hypothetical protein